MGIYQQPATAIVPAPAASGFGGLAASDDGDGPFPPAWVKTKEDYDAWFAAGVRKALDDRRPGIPDEEFWAMMDERLDEPREERTGRAIALA